MIQQNNRTSTGSVAKAAAKRSRPQTGVRTTATKPATRPARAARPARAGQSQSSRSRSNTTGRTAATGRTRTGQTRTNARTTGAGTGTRHQGQTNQTGARTQRSNQARNNRAGAQGQQTRGRNTRGRNTNQRGGRAQGQTGRGRTAARQGQGFQSSRAGVAARTIAQNKHLRRTTTMEQKVAKPAAKKGADGKKPKLRIIPLGGMEEIGRNSAIIEYGNDIIIIDLGIQFPEENMPGIDFVIPNIDYLKGKEANIKGVAITHGHLDHMGAVSHVVPKIGNPTVYAPGLARGIIEKRHEEVAPREKLNIHTVQPGDVVKLGVFTLEFFHVNHNIPDSMGIAVHTPEGIIINTGDFKFDHTPVGDMPADIAAIAKYHDQDVITLMCDSTSCEKKGYSISEKDIMENLEIIFTQTKGRLFMGMFSSHIGRIQQVMMLAEKFGRKVAIEGRSMKTYTDIAHKLKKININPKILIDSRDVKRYRDEEILVLATGGQGEQYAALTRLATNEHRVLKLQKGDTIVFSSSVVPGNERSVQAMRDNFYRFHAKVINYKMMDVHAGGHGWSEDNKMMIRLINPKYFLPIHGQVYMRAINGQLAEDMGYAENEVLLPDNGQVCEFRDGKGVLTEQRINADHVMVDGLGVGDVSHVVLRDREQLSEDGMFVIMMNVEARTGKLTAEPEILSRGFTFMKENSDIIKETGDVVKKIFEGNDPKAEASFGAIKKRVRNEVGSFLFKKTERRPMILPVIIET